MVLEIVSNLFSAMTSGGITDDDASDRLSYRVTTSILIVSSLLIGTKQLVGEPISCWIPAHFTGNHEEYTNSYCWIRNTYYLPWDENIPREHEPEKRYMITYYQWIPLILLLQALFFYLPRMIWLGMKGRVGVDVGLMLGEAKKLQNCMEYESHEKILDSMAHHMHRMLKRPHGKSKITASIKSVISRACCRCMGRAKGNYLVAVFMFTKIIFLANILGQMFVLNHVLGFNFHSFGIEVLEQLSQNKEWVHTPFPRVTMCDMNIRRLGNVHRYAVQCVLPLNLFTEKLYLFQWFWYVLLLVLASTELIQWFMRILAWKKQRQSYIEKHLQLAKDNFEQEDDMALHNVNAFVDNYLKQDGVFILRIIAKNTTQGCATMITHALWKKFEPWWREKQNEEPEDPFTPRKKSLPPYDDSTLPVSKAGRH